MDWKELIKNVDFGGSQGRADRKKNIPEKPTNPFSKKKVRPSGNRVDNTVPKGKIPHNKCDSWPDCRNNATKYCYVCCMKACDECYPLFGGGHPSRPFDGDPDYYEHCNIDSVTGESKEVEEDKYSSGKDW
tara:strand:- start:2481 stop:2873 length:393 start_codon:yes stop_codon:yes gene_type:complete